MRTGTAIPSMALFRGPGLVLEAVNEAWSSRGFDEPPIGVPISEAWADPAWAPVQEAMREVLATGRSAVVTCSYGPISLVAVEWRGCRAVVTVHRPDPRPTLARRSRPLGSARAA